MFRNGNFREKLLQLLPNDWQYRLWQWKQAQKVEQTRRYLRSMQIQIPPTQAASIGLNILGFFSNTLGLAEAARSTLRGASSVGLPVHLINIPLDGIAKGRLICPEYDGADLFAVNLFHCNPDLIAILMEESVARQYLRAKYNIGFWFWETSDLPEHWISAASMFDEIWTGSEFCKESIARSVHNPVLKIPLNISTTIAFPSTSDRKALGLPESGYIFLTVLDVMSQPERKNPLGAIEAFAKAFGSQPEGVHLVVKVLNRRLSGWYDRFRERCKNRPNVILMDKLMSRSELNCLMNASNCLLSLHRSEGFGLAIAEAMALGKPVIATGWSANMEFMTHKNSFPVKYRLTRLNQNAIPYPKGTQWAEADIDHAAEIMRKLVEDRTIEEEIGKQAKADIQSAFTPERTGRVIRERLEEVVRHLK